MQKWGGKSECFNRRLWRADKLGNPPLQKEKGPRVSNRIFSIQRIFRTPLYQNEPSKDSNNILQTKADEGGCSWHILSTIVDLSIDC